MYMIYDFHAIKQHGICNSGLITLSVSLTSTYFVDERFLTCSVGPLLQQSMTKKFAS